MGWTFAAFGPLGPFSASYETFAPSASVVKPLHWMAEWWTKRSLPWSSGVMKPKPFSSLNHFTVPVAIVMLLHGCSCCETREVLGNNCGTLALLAPGDRPAGTTPWY